MYGLKVPKFHDRGITGVVPFNKCGKFLSANYDSRWLYNEFGWDDIPSDMITDLLKNSHRLSKCNNINQGWQVSQRKLPICYEQRNLFSDDEDDWFHAERIAMLVVLIQQGAYVNRTQVVYDISTCDFELYDGNHRVRALKYLGYEGFPCTVYIPSYTEMSFVNQAIEREMLIPSPTKRLYVNVGSRLWY